jgi:hypothetical protein
MDRAVMSPSGVAVQTRPRRMNHNTTGGLGAARCVFHCQDRGHHGLFICSSWNLTAMSS